MGDFAALRLHVGNALVLAVDLLENLRKVALWESLCAMSSAVTLLLAGEGAADDGKKSKESTVELHLKGVSDCELPRMQIIL